MNDPLNRRFDTLNYGNPFQAVEFRVQKKKFISNAGWSARRMRMICLCIGPHDGLQTPMPKILRNIRVGVAKQRKGSEGKNDLVQGFQCRGAIHPAKGRTNCHEMKITREVIQREAFSE